MTVTRCVSRRRRKAPKIRQGSEEKKQTDTNETPHDWLPNGFSRGLSLNAEFAGENYHVVLNWFGELQRIVGAHN